MECIAVKLKLRNIWSTLIGLYRSPSLPKNIWRKELASLLEASTGKGGSVFLLGDLDCDLLCPDKPPKNGRDLLHIMGLFHKPRQLSNSGNSKDKYLAGFSSH